MHCHKQCACDTVGRPSCVAAVLQMGPSGSGKTTLLDLMAGRKTTGRTEGEVGAMAGLREKGECPQRAALRERWVKSMGQGKRVGLSVRKGSHQGRGAGNGWGKEKAG